MRFKALKGCRRPPEEQRLIWSYLGAWRTLSPARQETVRELIADIARSPLEGRALYDVLVRGAAPQTVNFRLGISVQRIYSMRREFYDRLPL